MEVTSVRAGSRRPPGGWKWTPFGRLELDGASARWRQADGAAPYARWNARVNASLRRVARLDRDVEDARRSLVGEPVRRPLEQHPPPNRPGVSPAVAATTRSKWKRDRYDARGEVLAARLVVVEVLGERVDEGDERVAC